VHARALETSRAAVAQTPAHVNFGCRGCVALNEYTHGIGPALVLLPAALCPLCCNTSISDNFCKNIGKFAGNI